jgi:hypothetical protein
MIKKAMTIVERNRRGLERRVSEDKQVLWIPWPHMKWLIPQKPWTLLLLTANPCSGCSAPLAIKFQQAASTSSWGGESAGLGSKSWIEVLQDSQPCRKRLISVPTFTKLISPIEEGSLKTWPYSLNERIRMLG